LTGSQDLPDRLNCIQEEVANIKTPHPVDLADPVILSVSSRRARRVVMVHI
jgi:hypothetical protein